MSNSVKLNELFKSSRLKSFMFFKDSMYSINLAPSVSSKVAKVLNPNSSTYIILDISNVIGLSLVIPSWLLASDKSIFC